MTDVHLGLCEPVLRRVAFLGQCPHLERLDIESQEFYPITRSDLDFDAVELGQLKSLTMRGPKCVYLPEKLTTPLLRSFSWYEVTHAFGPHVSAFLKRAPRISSFALDGIFDQIEPADYPSLLRCLPRVKTLAFTRIDIAINELFEALTIRSGEEVLPRISKKSSWIELQSAGMDLPSTALFGWSIRDGARRIIRSAGCYIVILQMTVCYQTC